mmetsp:Transcript_123195/g.359705  ORF Transcript_123195/g.359705 Transcript_123195/m.359705 type:complete len:277 (-) Transcript_123195:1269-2099(-)
MVNPKAMLEELANLSVPGLLHYLQVMSVLRMCTQVKGTMIIAILGYLHQRRSCVVGVPTGVHKNHALMAGSYLLNDDVVADLGILGHALHLICLRHPDEGRIQRNRPVGGVEVEQVLALHAHEARDVCVVRKRRREPHKPDRLPARLLVPQGPGHDGLYHRAPVLVQEVDLVDDDQLHQLLDAVIRGAAPRCAVARHDVPLLGHRDDDVHLLDLPLRELHVARELRDHDAQWAQALLELLGDLAHERLHGGHVDDLEVAAHAARGVHVLPDEPQDA